MSTDIKLLSEIYSNMYKSGVLDTVKELLNGSTGAEFNWPDSEDLRGGHMNIISINGKKFLDDIRDNITMYTTSGREKISNDLNGLTKVYNTLKQMGVQFSPKSVEKAKNMLTDTMSDDIQGGMDPARSGVHPDLQPQRRRS